VAQLALLKAISPLTTSGGLACLSCLRWAAAIRVSIHVNLRCHCWSRWGVTLKRDVNRKFQDAYHIVYVKTQQTVSIRGLTHGSWPSIDHLHRIMLRLLRTLFSKSLFPPGQYDRTYSSHVLTTCRYIGRYLFS
jgi:hypothetical protein